MRFRVSHRTTYDYEEPVSIANEEARLRPRSTPFQRVEWSRVAVVPVPASMVTRRDYYGNAVDVFAIEEPHTTFVVQAESMVVVEKRPLPEPSTTVSWEQARDFLRGRSAVEQLEAVPYRFDSVFASADPEIHAYAAESFAPGRPLLEAALELVHRIYTEFTYKPGVTSIATPLSEVMEKRMGVCQDFAHLLIASLRSFGLSARYVSGYLLTTPPPGKEKVLGADASHAWVSLHVPGLGFVDLDPTNDQIPAETYVTVGWGRDFGDVSPLKGVILGGGRHTVAVAVDVLPEG
ncbi:MAG: transglutaminase family protein [Polyangiales bacterium]